MFFADIHTHLLHSTDDGAEDRRDMYAMLDSAYADGIRLICATPHFYPEYFGDNSKKSEAAFAELAAYCREKYPDLKLFFGNELFYMRQSIAWLNENICRTLGDTRCVLVEFKVDSPERVILEAAKSLLNSGYVPIIAHAERYVNLGKKGLGDLKTGGAMIQVNARSYFARFSFSMKRRLHYMTEARLVDFVSTDSHDLAERPPQMSRCFAYLSEKYSERYALAICKNNAEKILCGNTPAEEK